MKNRQETIFNDREDIKNRDLKILMREHHIQHDNPIAQALLQAWEYGYMEAALRPREHSHTSHKHN